MLGTKIGQFTVKKKLGEGGMGIVYLAEHDLMRKKVAIKTLLPQWTQNSMIVQRFVNEAIATASIEHSNIIEIGDCGQLPDGSWYIVMEYLEGGTLAQFCASQGGPLSMHTALQLLAPTAAGLEAAHKLGIVHRDLKPENIFLIARQKNPHFVKILDWGISKLGEQAGGAITHTGMIAGTPAYMAPEQLRDLRLVDRRSDVYALGVIAYQMITGGWLPFQRPDAPEEFAQMSAPAILLTQMNEEPIDPRQRVPGVSDRWANAILAAIHRDPARRPQSAKALILMLAAATPGDGFLRSGTDIVDEYANELLEVGNLEETVRAPKPAVNVPQSASRYRIGDQLGAGGMAEVFRAQQMGAEGFSRVVAVKRVLPGFSAVPQFASMFVQEAKLASLLEHPNIVSVLDFDRDPEGRLFLAMEFVDGRDLASVAATGRLPFSSSIFIISEALHGLGHAHNLPNAEGPRGVVHRDVSPQNVLLSWDGAVKISDFGIAKAREATAATASTLIKGKPQYMSPEQANGLALDGRSDLFAIGIMLWELVTGRRLFAGSTEQTLALIAYGRVAPPSTVCADVPPDLEAVIMRLLAREVSARYANAELVIEDLARCADAPRNGRHELARLLADRFPDAVAARSSRAQGSSPPSAGAGSQSRVTLFDSPANGPQTRRDGSPKPTPAVRWPSNTTLGSAASQSVVPPRRTRSRWALVVGATLTVAIGTVAALVAVSGGEPSRAQPAATVPAPADATASQEPPEDVRDAIVRIDGGEAGSSPVTAPTTVPHDAGITSLDAATAVARPTRTRDTPRPPKKAKARPVETAPPPGNAPKFDPDDAIGE